MFITFFRILINKQSLLGFVFAVFFSPIPAQTLTLGDFENGELIVIRPDQSDPQTRYLWHENTDSSIGYSEVSADAARTGNYGLINFISSDSSPNSSSQMHFYPNEFDSVNHYRYMRTFFPSEQWQFDHFNRMRFWILMPSEISAAEQGRANLHFGTYIRSTSASDARAESDNGHYYHYYNIPPTGVWHQVVVDFHPHHQRGHSGSTEHGVKQYPTNESGYNYFDLLTRFYVHIRRDADSFPIVIRYDDFEVYYEPNEENIEEVYAINGSYRVEDNRLFLGWSRLKTENDAVHEVRYAFRDIHEIGWDAATPAPDGINPVDGHGGYNTVAYSSNTIDMEAYAQIYVAIKPQLSEKFRQLVVPLVNTQTSNSPPSKMLPPRVTAFQGASQ